MTHLFSATSLTLQFGGITAVDDVTFSIDRGEVFTIIGPNGAGKSSLFNIISRIYRPTSGRMFLDGEDITNIPPHHVAARGIGRTFQNIELFDHATVLRNLLVGRQPHVRTNFLQDMLFLPVVRREEVRHREVAERVIELLRLENVRDELIANLPYGTRKIVEIARALCSEPKLLLLDEPSSGLNPEETDDMAFWIDDIRSELDITVVLVEHDMGLVSRVSDRVMALNRGKVITIDEPSIVQQHPEVLTAYLGDAE
ncbi:ABC transporter ATP-binding protein [Martelella sp. FLE1502]